jgi:hypothetical protein
VHKPFHKSAAGTLVSSSTLFPVKKMSDVDISSLKLDTLLILFGETIIDFNSIFNAD